jgi:hypothetical protein
LDVGMIFFLFFSFLAGNVLSTALSILFAFYKSIKGNLYLYLQI